jgi:hypothetical protein
MTPCSPTDGYQYFSSTLMMEAAGPSKMLVSIYKSIWGQISEEHTIKFLTLANLCDYIKAKAQMSH